MAGAVLGMSDTYNHNCRPQKAIIETSIEFIHDAIDVLDVPSVNVIADYGSSHGLNSIYAMKEIISYLRQTNKIKHEPLVVHNDLPTNDWTSLFQQLTNDNSYCGVSCGRSFYEQCLPENSLAIGYSSTSIQWLSKKPCNISNHFLISCSQDEKELEAFKQQAYLDYTQFLQHRSRELMTGGVLILSIMAADERGLRGFEDLTNLVYKCAQLLPLTSQELFDFTHPVYGRSYEECIDKNLLTECSFELIKSKLVSIPSPLFKQWKEGEITRDDLIKANTLFVRSWAEPILRQVFLDNGRTREEIPALLNQFWNLYAEKIGEDLNAASFTINCVYLILKKK